MRSFAASMLVVAVASVAGAQPLGRSDLDNPIPQPMSFFGLAHAGVGDEVVVGAPGHFALGTSPGRVHVLDGRTGALLRSIENPTPAAGDSFGAEIVALGTDVLVGAPNDDTAGADAGAAYLFDGATGALEQTFVVPGSGPDWNCGASLAAVGNHAVLGCAGRGAYMFDATTGAFVRSFTPTLPSGFPAALATLGSDLLGTAAGTIHRFDTATGVETQTYVAPAIYGGSLATLPDRILAGAHVGGTDSVIVFDAASGAIVQEIGVPDVNTSTDFFGSSIAVNGNAILIGSRETIFLFDDTYALRQILLPTTTFHGSIGPTVSAHASGFTIARTPPKGVVGSGGIVLTDLCGNGVRADSEACDDGNATDGDGCSASCRIEACPPAPVMGCAQPTKTGAASLDMVEEYSTTGEKDRFRFRWRGGGTATDFGDPRVTATHVMCLWDRVPSIPRVRMNNAVPPGGTCDGKPCWTARGSNGFKLADPLRTPSGIEKMDVRATAAGAIIAVDGRGPNLGVPEPPSGCPDCGVGVVGTVVVQVHNLETGACWSATFVHPSRNEKRRYKARSD